MTRLRIRLLLTVTALASAAGPAIGQQVVYDPSNYAQNVLQAARALQQINNQIQQLENQTQSLINQAKHLVSLPYSLVSTITGQIQRTEQLIAQAQQRWQNSVAGLQDAMRMQATVVGNIPTSRTSVTTLGASSQSASGSLQANQVTNQLLVQISQQLADLIALQAAHSRAQTLVAAANATDQNQGTGQLSAFLTPRSGYQAQTIQMFH